MIETATIRPAQSGDAGVLAALHAEAWRYAYRGIIPGVALERMIARRGPVWWAAQCTVRAGPRGGARGGTLLAEFDGRIVGYASFGTARVGGRARMGEIFELYVKPECHGAGFGRILFEEARRRLRAAGVTWLIVWALAENDLACGFYAAMGGRARWRTAQRLAGVRLEKIGYHWA